MNEWWKEQFSKDGQIMSLQIDNVLDINASDDWERILNENGHARMVESGYLPYDIRLVSPWQSEAI